MGHRTDSMYRQAYREQEASVPAEVHHGLIKGRRWKFSPGDRRCDDCYTLETKASAKRPPEAHSCVVLKGKMICFIFLALTFACLWAGFLVKGALACAVGTV